MFWTQIWYGEFNAYLFKVKKKLCRGGNFSKPNQSLINCCISEIFKPGFSVYNNHNLTLVYCVVRKLKISDIQRYILLNLSSFF